MVKLSDIKAEINELTSLDKNTDDKILNRARKRVELLKHVERYMRSKPTEVFVAAEVKRLENRINLISAEFVEPEKADKKTVTKLRKAHESEYGVGHLRTQLRTLRFIVK